MKRTALAGFVLALFCPAFAAALEVVHDPVLTAAAGQDVEVSAALTGADSSVRARLFYRTKGKELYASDEMSGPANRIAAVIPGKLVTSAGVEYYIEAAIFSGASKQTASSPQAAPDRNPHSISVRKDEAAPGLEILSPLDGDTVESSTPVITVAFTDAEAGIDASSVLIKIDGAAISDTGNIQAFDTLVSYVPSKPLADGEHKFSVTVKDKAGNPGTVSWSVRVGAGAEAKEKSKGFRWNGLVGYDTQYGHVAQQPKDPNAYLPHRPYGVNRGRVQVTGRGEENVLKLSVYKTDEERTDQQPLDRYTGSWSNDGGNITLGDITSLSFSPLSLYNLYLLRGASFDLRSGGLEEGHSRLQAAWGYTRRGIDAGVSAFTGAPGAATYAQELYGVRWEVGSPWFLWGFNHVTVNDQAGSVGNVAGQTPSYNMVEATDIKMVLWFLTLSAEAGMDLATSGQTPLGISAGHAYRGTADLNIKPWGTKASFEWRDLGGSYSFGGMALPGGYTTMANPGLQQDYRGYESSLSQSLFDGQFSVGANHNNWIDNLQGQKNASSGTTTNEFTSVFTTLALEKLPSLTGTYTHSKLANDLRSNTVTGLYQMANDTQSISANLGYNLFLGERDMLGGNLTWVGTRYRDMASVPLTQDLDSDSYILGLFCSLGASSFSGSTSLNRTFNQKMQVNPVLVFGQSERSSNGATYSLRWGQQWVPRVFDSSLSWDMNYYGQEARALLYYSSAVRSSYRLSLGYTPAPEHRLSLGATYSLVNRDSRSGALDTGDGAAMILSQAGYTWTF